MKKMSPFTGWALCSSAAIIFAGCARNQETAQAVETSKPNAVASLVPRTEGVPSGVETPSGLTVPKGFQVNIFAEGLTNPRRLAIAPGATPGKYDVFVAESKANRIRVLREANGDGKADEKFVFTEGVSQPYGLAFIKDWLYVGNTDAVVRFPYDVGQTATDQPSQEIAKLTAGGYNQHWTRNLLFSRDGKKLYVTVGSSCNTCEEDDPQRAAISVMNPDGSGRRVLASGLRNPVGVTLRPGTNELWTVVNERDQLGDDTPPDYLTQVEDGRFYGWPYAYTNLDGSIVPDPTFGDKNPEKLKSTQAATVPVQAHSAALGLAFYPENRLLSRPRRDRPQLVKGFNPFPHSYFGDAFLAYHGSWNRSERTGYKIVRVDFEKGKAVSISDFVTGFLKNGQVSGRPVDVQVAPDGSILFSDDDGGKIWRVSRAK